MSSPRSSSLSPSSSTSLTISSTTLSFTMEDYLSSLATSPQTGLSSYSSEATVVSTPSVIPTEDPEFDMDQIMTEFPEAQMVDYTDMQREQVVSPSATSSKEIVSCKTPKALNLENLHERIEEAVTKVVREAADKLMKLADAVSEKKKKRKRQGASDSKKKNHELVTVTPPQAAPTHHESPKQQEASDSTKEHDELMTETPQQAPTSDHNESPEQQEASESTKEHDELMTETPQQAPTSSDQNGIPQMTETMTATPQQAPTHHESPSMTETRPVVCRRQAQPATKLVSQIPNVSFEIPDEMKVDDDTINKFVPSDEIVKNISAQNGKKYSFCDRLHGWKMECRIRLNGTRQYDKYYTHLQSKTATRSVPEAVKFILYEVSPKQMREANKKRKMLDFWDEAPGTSSQNALPLDDEDLSMEGFATVLEDRLDEPYNEMWFRIAYDNLVNSTAIAAPSEERWEEMKAAAKRRAKCRLENSTPKPDVEAANALIGLAAEESVTRKRQKTSK